MCKKDIIPNYTKYFSPGEARKAFGLYLGYILRKISQSNADSTCCDLVMKFLQHSSCSLRTPFLFTVFDNFRYFEQDYSIDTSIF